MSANKIRVSLDNIKVVDGQGAGEGDFEMRVQATEGNHNLVWPNATGWNKIDKGGPAYSIDQDIAVYTIASGSLTKTINLYVTEVDGGTLGKDDTGSASVTFTLQPNMQPSVKSVTIPLKRPNMKYEGKVLLTLKAQVA